MPASIEIDDLKPDPDRNPDLSHDLMDLYLARDTPLIKVSCIFFYHIESGSQSRSSPKSNRLFFGLRHTSGKTVMQICHYFSSNLTASQKDNKPARSKQPSWWNQ